MDLAFTEEQTLLRDSIARLLAERAPLGSVRAIEASASGYDPALFREFAEMGILGVHLPEDQHGGGAGFLTLALVAIELGAAAYPGPFFSSVVECGLLLSALPERSPHRALLGQLARGRTKLALARYEADTGESEQAIRLVATRDGGGFILDGCKLFARDADHADVLLVAARAPAGVTMFAVKREAPGVSVRVMPSLARDRLCEVRLDRVHLGSDAIVGEEGCGYELLLDAQLRASVVKAAEMVGGMRTSVRLTADYLRTREQYGKPIGIFQALQHDMAEMLTSLDISESYLYKVASLVEHGEPLDPSASMLKAYVSESYRFVTERAVQLHGAIGTTEEHPISLFYQRSKAAETALGSAAHHYARVAASLGL